MRVLVTGATGFVGKRLLSKLNQPVLLSRNPGQAEKIFSGCGIQAFAWDPENQPAPADAFAGIDAVIHLAGEPVAEGRWTAAKKVRMRESRVVGTRNLVQTLVQLPVKPKVLISASAVGYYGDRGDERLTEQSAPQDDFLAEICVAWERETQRASEAGIRVVNPRIGIVLGEGGGALAKMLPPFLMGVGSPLGSGRQYMPWIHLDDLCELLLYAVKQPSLIGPINATAPHPVTNHDFTHTLGKVLRRPTFFPAVPGFALRLVLGEFARVLLMSQNAIPAAALAAGFQFQFAELEPALRHVLKR